MIPRQNRPTRPEVEDIIKNGRSVQGVFVSFKYKTIPVSKATIVVTKKVGKTAVLRNRIKRRLRAIISSLLLESKRPIGVVVFAKAPVIEALAKDLQSEVKNLFQKIIK